MAKTNSGVQIALIKQSEIGISDLKTQLIKQEHLIKQTSSELDIVMITLLKMKVISAIDYYVTKSDTEMDQYAQDTPITLKILGLYQAWVKSDFSETSVNKIYISIRVAIKSDTYLNKTFCGYVESLQSGSGSIFNIPHPQNSVGNFIKIVQRIPVKIDITASYNSKTPIYPVLSVEPYVSIK